MHGRSSSPTWAKWPKIPWNFLHNQFRSTRKPFMSINWINNSSFPSVTALIQRLWISHILNVGHLSFAGLHRPLCLLPTSSLNPLVTARRLLAIHQFIHHHISISTPRPAFAVLAKRLIHRIHTNPLPSPKIYDGSAGVWMAGSGMIEADYLGIGKINSLYWHKVPSLCTPPLHLQISGALAPFASTFYYRDRRSQCRVSGTTMMNYNAL